MGEQLQGNLGDARATAQHLADASSRMKKLRKDLQTQLDAEGPAWGNDKVGKSFAEGAQGYLAQADNVFSTVDAMTDWLDSTAQSLRDAANNIEQADG